MLALEQLDGVEVLLRAKHELGLFFALRCLPPDRHDGGQENGHDAQRHEQRRHGIPLGAVSRDSTRVLTP